MRQPASQKSNRGFGFRFKLILLKSNVNRKITEYGASYRGQAGIRDGAFGIFIQSDTDRVFERPNIVRHGLLQAAGE